MERPDKTMYFLKIALSVAARSTCLRRKYGAVIVNGNTIVGTGYNGPAKGVVNCMEVGCIKDMMELPRAKLYLSGLDADGKYTEAIPCQRCKRKIINSEIDEVIVLNSKGEPESYSVESWIKEDSDWYMGLIKEAKN